MSATRFVDSLIRGVEALSRACGMVAAACLGAACLVVCHMVLVRYAFGAATIWQTEFVTFAVVASTLIGSPYVLLTRGHVTVDLLPHYLSEKPRRRLALGANANLYFEDRLTIQYQVQEMLRIEKIFERDAIEEELAAYNPLIPDGHNWKATFMLEYDDPAERSDMLAKLVGVEDCVWMRVGAGPVITPVCDEDLERATGDKISSVHFMRFELSPEVIATLRQSEEIPAGLSQAEYSCKVTPIPAEIRKSLLDDLD